MANPTFGIHFGNSTFTIACHSDGRNTVLSNSRGDRTSPSIVCISNEEKVIGMTAKQRVGRPNVNIIQGMKAMIQTKKNYLPEWPTSGGAAEATFGKEIMFSIKTEDGVSKKIPVEEILKIVFQELFEIAKSQQVKETDPLRAVVCVPVEFLPSDVELLQEIADGVGFQSTQIILEPAAAMLAYDVAQADNTVSSTCIVYRVGGKTSDISLVTTASGLYSIEGHKYYPNLGGDIFTKALVDHFRGEFKSKFKVDPCEDNRRGIHKLFSAAEDCKHILSSKNTAHAFIESLRDGTDFSSNVTQARFESIVSPFLEKFLEPVRELLAETELGFADVDKVILVGGSMKVPRLQKIIRDLFPPETEVLCSIPADEVLARGAAQQSSFKSSELSVRRDLIVTDNGVEEESHRTYQASVELPCLSRGIFFKVCLANGEGRAQCLFPSNSVVPAHRMVPLDLTKDIEEGKVSVALYEADKPKQLLEGGGEDSAFLGEMALEDLPEDAHVTLSCSISDDGTVVVILRDSVSNKLTELNLEAEEGEF